MCLNTHCKVEDEKVGCVHHILVLDDDTNHEDVPDEAGDDDEGEEDGHEEGDNLHQDGQVLEVILVKLLASVIQLGGV